MLFVLNFKIKKIADLAAKFEWLLNNNNKSQAIFAAFFAESKTVEQEDDIKAKVHLMLLQSALLVSY